MTSALVSASWAIASQKQKCTTEEDIASQGEEEP